MDLQNAGPRLINANNLPSLAIFQFVDEEEQEESPINNFLNN
jgi:hypothetical protein